MRYLEIRQFGLDKHELILENLDFLVQKVHVQGDADDDKDQKNVQLGRDAQHVIILRDIFEKQTKTHQPSPKSLPTISS
jgi:hypothetical protein